MNRLRMLAFIVCLCAPSMAHATCATGSWNNAGNTQYYTLYNSCVGRINVRYCANSSCNSITLDTGNRSEWIAINNPNANINWCECRAPKQPRMSGGECYC